VFDGLIYSMYFSTRNGMDKINKFQLSNINVTSNLMPCSCLNSYEISEVFLSFYSLTVKAKSAGRVAVNVCHHFSIPGITESILYRQFWHVFVLSTPPPSTLRALFDVSFGVVRNGERAWISSVLPSWLSECRCVRAAYLHTRLTVFGFILCHLNWENVLFYCRQRCVPF
jgi:hypothetical protein